MPGHERLAVQLGFMDKDAELIQTVYGYKDSDGDMLPNLLETTNILACGVNLPVENLYIRCCEDSFDDVIRQSGLGRLGRYGITSPDADLTYGREVSPVRRSPRISSDPLERREQREEEETEGRRDKIWACLQSYGISPARYGYNLKRATSTALPSVVAEHGEPAQKQLKVNVDSWWFVEFLDDEERANIVCNSDFYDRMKDDGVLMRKLLLQRLDLNTSHYSVLSSGVSSEPASRRKVRFVNE
jgi:hypothetical protein